MEDRKREYERAIDTLQDDERTSFAFVGKPETPRSTRSNAARATSPTSGSSPNSLILNGYLPESVCEDPFFEGKRADEQAVIERARESSTPTRRRRTRSSPVRSPVLICSETWAVSSTTARRRPSTSGRRPTLRPTVRSTSTRWRTPTRSSINSHRVTRRSTSSSPGKAASAEYGRLDGGDETC